MHGFTVKDVPKIIYGGSCHKLIKVQNNLISKYLISFLKGNHRCSNKN